MPSPSRMCLQVLSNKETLLSEQMRLQRERDLLRHEQLQPEKICAALKRFDTLWEHMSRDERREVVNLVIARVDVRAPAPNAVHDKSLRTLKIRVQLHLPELLSAEHEFSTQSQKKILAIDATVQLSAGKSGEVTITAPFRHRVTTPVRREKKPAKQYALENTHPIHRALALRKTLEANPGMEEQTLAARERLSPSTVCQLLKLTRLCPKVIEALLLIDNRASAWRFSIRRLLPLVTLSPADQWATFEKIGRTKRVRTKRSKAE